MKKFSYNPFNNEFLDCGFLNHAESLYNKGQQKNFDNYIRGIIAEDVLYLRLYYPFEDIESLSYDKIKASSKVLLQQNKNNILKAIIKEYNITISDIVFNADNDLLKNKLQVNYI